MTRMRDQMKPYLALSAQAESLPAIGIVAAVLGVIKAMGAIDQSPAILGGLIGAATGRHLRGDLCSLCARRAAGQQGEVGEGEEEAASMFWSSRHCLPS